MARDWQVACKECGEPLLYSERSRADALARGQSPPERCIKHRAEHSRSISRLAVKYLDMEPGSPLPVQGLKAGRLGKLARPDRPHQEVTMSRFLPPPADTFGIQDDEIVTLLTKLEGIQVAVIVAGTGSGKSTFLPWRLLVPPAPFPEDHLTRYGKIVVTQPRIEASTGIPQYVARTLHGSSAGPGTDIGYENSKNKDKSDSRNKLVYLTDGTLVNMIRKGALHEVSTVVIDEAHERSLNIDLILALLRRELHGLPHLKVLIVSATIDTDTFKDFFEPDFPVLVTTMRSKGIHPVHERWWAGPELPIPSWPAQMPGRAATTVAEILRWMVDGTAPPDIPVDVEAYQGDILVFLTGKRPIEEAISATRELIESDPVLNAAADSIELLPLYSELPAVQRRRPLEPEKRSKKNKYRVIYSTNLAETSLTIDGVRHVVDAGLINRKSWDSATATESMQQVPHSQHGLRQRRGRAGRTHAGVWHCLYTQAQFNALDSDTPPEITRAPLPAVLLAAAVAGVSDPTSLTWLAPGPPTGEVGRALAALRAIGAIDEHGDPTPVGRELATTRTSFDDAAILVTADEAGCAIEAATVLAAKSEECRNQLLLWSKRWPATAKVHVDNVHQALLSGAIDDVDVVCRIWAGWESQADRDGKLAWAKRHYVDSTVMEALEAKRRQLLEPLMAKTRSSEIRLLDLRLLPRLRAAIAWANPNSLYVAQRSTSDDARASAIASLTPSVSPRSDTAVVTAMHSAARPALDDESWVSRHLPEDSVCLVLLNRQVRNRFATPLAPPERVLLATFSVAVAPELLFDGDDWLAAVARVPLGAAIELPKAIPGDRFLADLLPTGQGNPSQLRLLSTLTPMPDPTIEIEDDDEQVDEWQDASDELPTDVGGRGEAEWEAAAELAEPVVEDSGAPDDDLEDLDGSITSAAQTNMLGLRAELDESHRGGAPSGHFEVVVSAVAEDGQITCIPDTRAELFAAFAEEHVGRLVTLMLDDVRVFPRDRQPILLARHAESGFTTAVDPRHIGVGMRYPQLRTLAANASWDFVLMAADRELLMLELSQTDATLHALTRLAGDRTPFRTTGYIVDVYLDAIYIEITPDAGRIRPGDPPIVLRVFAKELPQAPERIRLGASVPVALTWQTRRRETVDLDSVDSSKLPTGPWEVRGDQLAATGVMTVADWQRLIDFSTQIVDPIEAARFRAQVSRLATRVLSPKVRVIDEQLFTATVDQGRVDAQVVSVLADGALKVLTPMGEQLIGSREADLYRSLGNATTAASTIPIFVDRPDTELASLTVRLFDPAERERLAIGDVVDTRIGALTASGKEAHVHTLTGVEGLARVETLPTGYDEGDVLPMRVTDLPDQSPVRMSGRHVRTLVALSPQLAAVIQPGPPNRGGWDIRPFTALAEFCDLAITGVPPTHIDIHCDQTPTGQNSSRELVASITGGLWQIAVPHHQPLRANNRQVIRAISGDTGCTLIDGRRPSDRGFPENFVWVAAPNAAAATRAINLINAAYPQVWVSDWFKRTGAEWGAATTAVKARAGRIRSVKSFDTRGKPVFRAVIACDPGDEAHLLAAARAECPSIPYGSFTADPSITATEIVQSPPSKELTPSSPPSSIWQAPTDEGAANFQAFRARTPTSTWAARPEPGPGHEPVVRTELPPRPPTTTWRPSPSSEPPIARQQSRPRTVTRSGPSVEDAVNAACAELGVDPSQVDYVVLDEGHRRLFGKRPAQVQVTLR